MRKSRDLVQILHMAAPPPVRAQVREGTFRSGECRHAGPPTPDMTGDSAWRRSTAPGLSRMSALAPLARSRVSKSLCFVQKSPAVGLQHQ